jgi:hypothetical protein
MTKPRIHNEWFQPIVKTSCPCGRKKTTVVAWGQYVRCRWNTIDHCCQDCFDSRVVGRLLAHAGQCGCHFQLQARSGYRLPDWIRMPPAIGRALET